MSLVPLTQLTAKQRNLDILAGQDGDLVDLLTEIRGLTFTLTTGAGVSTNIAVSGIATVDTLLKVLEFTVSTGDIQAIVDRTATSSITSAGNIRSTDDTTGSQILVIWYNKS